MRSAMKLAACVLAVALALTPIAVRQEGSGGPIGLAVAAAICLLSGLLAEGAGCYLSQAVSPLAGVMSGMAVRMILPLAVCVALASLGHDGRHHLAFVCYLLAFYIVTLIVETWLAVKRVAGPSSALNKNAR
jgi:hypothetical protein